MINTGVLVHVYYLEAGWEALVWGDPARGIMGTLPKLVQLMLVENPDEPITDIVMYTGPSRRDGLNEGEYGKKYLLDHFDQLASFPQLKPLFEKLTDKQQHGLYHKLEERIHTREQLVNSADEVLNAAKFFQERNITKVFQIAAASHAPRCIQLQTIVRYKGQIPTEQFWFTIAADTSYVNTTPSDVVVAEPPHRGDDPALGVHPSITDILKQYYKLPYEARQPFLRAVESALDGLPEYQ
ncbi:MAG: hypothetical protein ACHQT5_00050 [Candidatus Saccharimonadales bacterium]